MFFSIWKKGVDSVVHTEPFCLKDFVKSVYFTREIGFSPHCVTTAANNNSNANISAKIFARSLIAAHLSVAFVDIAAILLANNMVGRVSFQSAESGHIFCFGLRIRYLGFKM